MAIQTFAGILRNARTRAGHTQAWLGAQTYPTIDPASAKHRIYKLEAGTTSPTEDELRRFSEILDLPGLGQPNCDGSLICPGCKVMFMPKNGHQVYCTPKCRYKHWWAGYYLRRKAQPYHRRDKKLVAYKRPQTVDTVHMKHLREMGPDKLIRTLDDILKGKVEYAGRRQVRMLSTEE